MEDSKQAAEVMVRAHCHLIRKLSHQQTLSHHLLPRKIKWSPFSTFLKVQLSMFSQSHKRKYSASVYKTMWAIKSRPRFRMWRGAERRLKINWPPSTWSWGIKSESASWLEMLNSSRKKLSDRSNLGKSTPFRSGGKRPISWRLRGLRKNSWTGRKTEAQLQLHSVFVCKGSRLNRESRWSLPVEKYEYDISDKTALPT